MAIHPPIHTDSYKPFHVQYGMFLSGHVEFLGKILRFNYFISNWYPLSTFTQPMMHMRTSALENNNIQSYQSSIYMHAHTSCQKCMHEHSYSIFHSLQHQTFLLFPELMVSIGNCYPGNRAERRWVNGQKKKGGKNKDGGDAATSTWVVSLLIVSSLFHLHSDWKSEEN